MNLLELQKQEPLLNSTALNTVAFFPIEYQDCYDDYKTAEAATWHATDIQYSRDLDDYHEKLSTNQRHYVDHILAFFLISDGYVSENLGNNFGSEIKPVHVSAFYKHQDFMETVHNETYGLFVETLIRDPSRKVEIQKNALDSSSIKAKADYMKKWMNPERPMVERLIAFMAAEGVGFSSSFAAIFWLMDQNLMPAFSQANRYIARDENMHCEYGIKVYNHFRYKLTEERIHEIVVDMVNMEKQFAEEGLPVGLLGMNSGLMSQHIESVADYWVTRVKTDKGTYCGPIFGKNGNQKTPFTFMEKISLETKENFFEDRPTQYQKPGVTSTAVQRTLSLNAEF